MPSARGVSAGRVQGPGQRLGAATGLRSGTRGWKPAETLAPGSGPRRARTLTSAKTPEDDRQDETSLRENVQRPRHDPAARTTPSQASRADNADALRRPGRWGPAGGAPPMPRPRPAHERRGHAPRLCPERSPAPDLSGPLLALGVPPRHKPRPHALRPPPPCPVLAPGSRTRGSAPRQLKGWQFWEGGAPCPPLPPPPPLGPLRVRALSRQKGERSGPQQLGQICREMRCRKIANP